MSKIKADQLRAIPGQSQAWETALEPPKTKVTVRWPTRIFISADFQSATLRRCDALHLIVVRSQTVRSGAACPGFKFFKVVFHGPTTCRKGSRTSYVDESRNSADDFPVYRVMAAGSQKLGPVGAQEIRQWIAEGRINSDTLIAVDETTDWRPVSTFPEFAAFAPPATVPVTPTFINAEPVTPLHRIPPARRKLSLTRIALAFAVAVAVDIIQLPITILEFTGIVNMGASTAAGEGFDVVCDTVACAVISYLIGFHWLLLPTFALECIPIIDGLPTWTACVAYVVRRRKKEEAELRNL